MKFSEALERFNKGERIQPILCSISGINILENVRFLNGAGKFKYYKDFMDLLGDIEQPKYAPVCYEVYMKHYHAKFMRDFRESQVKTANAMLCKAFNVPARFYGTSLNIKPRDGQQQLCTVAKNYAKNFSNVLTLGSKTRGVGKTTMAVAVLMQWFIEHDSKKITLFDVPLQFLNRSIIFVEEKNIVNILRAGIAYHVTLLNRLVEADFIVYDDMLKYGDFEFYKSFILPMFVERDNLNKPAVITTTYPLDLLREKYIDLHSRLDRGTIYYSDIKTDYRKK